MTTMKTTRQTTVRPALPGEFDWADEPTGPTTSIARQTFVPASGSAQLPAVKLADPTVTVAASLPVPAVVATEVTGSHVDRAQAFFIKSAAMSLSFAIVSVVAAVTLWGVPLLSWSALLILTGMYFVAFAFLWLRDLQHSPEGIALLHTSRLWGWLEREQAHRHKIEREMWQDHRTAQQRNQSRRGQ
jgi:hypothetical protein